jgi:cytochrome-b5 reductase
VLYASVAALLAGGGGYYYYSRGGNAADIKNAVNEAADKAKARAGGQVAKAALTGGDQGFIPLKLESVENVNHNTKKFRFQLPEPDQVSGLHIASAILTKYKGPDMEKPVVRPYTPVSDEGLIWLSRHP